MSFPINPSLDQQITKGNKTYKWTGYSWSRVSTTSVSLASNAVTTNAISNASVTADKIDPVLLSNIVTVSNLTAYATTTHVSNEIANLVSSAPSTLDTLNELATALGNDASFATTVATTLSTKANTASLTTANVTEVTNLYFTNTRAISAFTSGSGISIAANGRITGASQYSNTDVQAYLGNISGALIPSADEAYNLGTETNKWANLFLSGNTIVLGQTKIESSGDGSISIKSTNTQVTTAISFASNGYIATPAGPISTSSGVVSSTPRISNVIVTDSSYNVLDDTSANSGGYITINGANFDSGVSVIISSTNANSVTFVNSSKLNVALPLLNAGTYNVYVVNSDGSTAQKINGLSISGNPVWSTAAGSIGFVYESIPITTTINAISDSLITYTILSGTLPTGANLNPANGYISAANAELTNSNITYNFTVDSTDNELQNTSRSFSLSVLTDGVGFVSSNVNDIIIVSNGTSFSYTINAFSLSGRPLIYSSNSLPSNISLTGNVISGIPNLEGNSYSFFTANSSVTNKSNIFGVCFVVVEPSILLDYLIVAGGGGGGGYNNGGGGGAGGFLTGSSSFKLKYASNGLPCPYTIVLGAGGGGGTASGAQGSNSLFHNLTSCGGGAGVSGHGAFPGGSGGSGGGGSGAGGAGIPGQGNPGGSAAQYNAPGGGGGAGGAGIPGHPVRELIPCFGWGGCGCFSSLSGSNVAYAGGGGAGYSGGPQGGTFYGGGGCGNQSGNVNTGGGGGGAGYGYPPGSGSPGGSGVVVLRIPSSYSASFGGNIASNLNSSIPGYKSYTITAGSGNVCFI